MIDSLYPCFKHWGEKGGIFIFSDPHFGDSDMVHFAEDWLVPNEMVRNINSKVGKNDTLICLGDVGDTSYVRHLRGYKVLITGNHDAGATTYERKIHTFREYCSEYTKNQVMEKAEMLYPDCSYHIVRDYSQWSRYGCWEVTADNGLFDEVYDGPLFISPKLVLSHEPITLPGNFAMNIHGHRHNRNYKNDEYHYNVSMNCHNYLPLNLNQFLKSGALSKITSLHRLAIDNAIARSKN